MQKCTDTSWPKFDEMTMDNFYYGLGKTLLEYETSVLEFEEKCAQGVMDFDELFQNIEAATCQFEYTWSLVGLFSFHFPKMLNFVWSHLLTKRKVIGKFELKILTLLIPLSNLWFLW